MRFPLRICMWRSKKEKKKELYQETRETLSSALPMFDKGLYYLKGASISTAAFQSSFLL